MRRRTLLAALLLALVVVPAGVFAATNGRFAAQIQGQEMFWKDGGAATNATQFRQLFQGRSASGAAAVTVSADLAQGRARFRVIAKDEATGELYGVHPAGVTFRPGAQSYEFAISAPNSLYTYTVQWRRVGAKKARASSLTTRYLGSPD